MAGKDIKKEEKIVKAKYTSSCMNLCIAGTRIQFKEGQYETVDKKEIELLDKNNLVTRVE